MQVCIGFQRWHATMATDGNKPSHGYSIEECRAITTTYVVVNVENDFTRRQGRSGGKVATRIKLRLVDSMACQEQEDSAGFSAWAKTSLEATRFHTPPRDSSQDNSEAFAERLWPFRAADVEWCYHSKERLSNGGRRLVRVDGDIVGGHTKEYFFKSLEEVEEEEFEEGLNAQDTSESGDKDKRQLAKVACVPPPNAFFPRHIYPHPRRRDRQKDTTMAILREHMWVEAQKSRDGMFVAPSGVWDLTFKDGKIHEHYKGTAFAAKWRKYVDHRRCVVSSKMLSDEGRALVLTRTGHNKVVFNFVSSIAAQSAAGHVYRGSMASEGIAMDDSGATSVLPTFEMEFDQKALKGDAPYSLGVYPPPATAEAGGVEFEGFGKPLDNRAMALVLANVKTSKATSMVSQHVVCVLLYRVVPHEMFLNKSANVEVDATMYSDYLVAVSLDLSLVTCPSDRYWLAAEHLSRCKPMTAMGYYTDPSEAWHHKEQEMEAAALGTPLKNKPYWVE